MRGVALNARRRGPGRLRYSPSLYHMDSETPLPPSCSDGALRRLSRGFHACAAALHRGDGDGADAAAVLWAGSSKKASLTDVARALDVRSSRGPAIGRDVDLAIRALLRRTRSKAGKKDA